MKKIYEQPELELLVYAVREARMLDESNTVPTGDPNELPVIPIG